jgi:hypothetical protein
VDGRCSLLAHLRLSSTHRRARPVLLLLASNPAPAPSTPHPCYACLTALQPCVQCTGVRRRHHRGLASLTAQPRPRGRVSRVRRATSRPAGRSPSPPLRACAAALHGCHVRSVQRRKKKDFFANKIFSKSQISPQFSKGHNLFILTLFFMFFIST